MTASTLMSKSKKALADLVIAKEEELVEVTEQNSDLINEVTNLRKQYTELTSKYDSSRANIETLTKRNKDLEEELVGTINKYNSVQEKYEQALADSVNAKNRIKELTNEVQQCNETINRKEGRINELTTSLKQASDQRDKFETLNNEYQKEIDDMVETNAILTKKANDFKLATISLAILVVISIIFVFIV